jgi:hypothetical protein
MATASRSRAPAGAKQTGRAALATSAARGALRSWGVPGAAVVAIAVLVALESAELVGTPAALAWTIAASLVLLLWIGQRPLLVGSHAARDRALAASLAAIWFAACYLPFHVRIFPGHPLVDGAQLSSTGAGLPLRIPAAGARAIDLELEGKLTPSAGGGVAPPVHYRLTVEGAGETRVVDGVFEDRLATRRLGRRGSATVHQTHTADVRVFSNPGRADLTVTHLVLEPESAQPITLTAFVHPLPGVVVLGLAAAALLAATIAFDRLGPVPETDGALTLATAGALGTALIFWTSNAVHPDYSALIGSVIFGGPLGFAAGAMVWWLAKRLIARPAR